eukprot:767143-Hanusia_phi.AAC.6
MAATGTGCRDTGEERAAAGPTLRSRASENRISLASEESEASGNKDDEVGPEEEGASGDDDDGEQKDGEANDRKRKSKVLGKDKRKIRKIKDDSALSEETRHLQEREEERRKCEQELLKKSIDDSMRDRGIINPLAESGSQIRIHPKLAARMKDHQIDGVRFMWRRLMDGRSYKAARGGLGSLLALEENDKGTGCILAHSMGLGKTFQVITLLHTIAANIPQNNLELRRMLVLGPVNTLHNWKAEFERWLPERGRLLCGNHIEIFVLDEAVRTTTSRCECLEHWFKKGGVMCMGYEMYRNLGQGTRINDKDLRAKLHRYLKSPGPGIVIADEGHILRNHKSNISKALSGVETKRRVVLTDSPLQNNLTEYRCMVDFISPGYLGTLSDFRNRFEIPILNGEAEDAGERDVQRKDYTPLIKALPPKFEFTLQIRLSPLQQRLYRYAVENPEECGIESVFKAFHTFMKIWNHPAILWNSKKHPEDDNQTESNAGTKNSNTEALDGEDYDSNVLCTDPPPFPPPVGRSCTKKPYNASWYQKLFESSNLNEESVMSLEHSGKVLVLWKLLTEANRVGEKVLVFSQSLTMLDLIEKLLERNPVCGNYYRREHDYHRWDGSRSSKQCQDDIDKFNDIAKSRARLFLISTRAGSLGVNMVAANRVVLFDCSFNPSHDLQAIFRTYRYGQTRPVYVYRLVSWGTMEEKIYKRRINKQSRPASAVDSWQVQKHFKGKDLEFKMHEILTLDDEIYLDDVEDEGWSAPSKKKLMEVQETLKKDQILRSMLMRASFQNGKDQFAKQRWRMIRTVEMDESLICDTEHEQLTEQQKEEAFQEVSYNIMANGNYMLNCSRCSQHLTVKQGSAKFGCPKCEGIFRCFLALPTPARSFTPVVLPRQVGQGLDAAVSLHTGTCDRTAPAPTAPLPRYRSRRAVGRPEQLHPRHHACMTSYTPGGQTEGQGNRSPSPTRAVVPAVPTVAP